MVTVFWYYSPFLSLPPSSLHLTSWYVDSTGKCNNLMFGMQCEHDSCYTYGTPEWLTASRLRSDWWASLWDEPFVTNAFLRHHLWNNCLIWCGGKLTDVSWSVHLPVAAWNVLKKTLVMMCLLNLEMTLKCVSMRTIYLWKIQMSSVIPRIQIHDDTIIDVPYIYSKLYTWIPKFSSSVRLKIIVSDINIV